MQVKICSLLLVGLAAIVGCTSYPQGPPRLIAEAVRAWPDYPGYLQYLDPAGRVIALAYDDDRDGEPEVRIDLPDDRGPHYLILLDGIPYRLVRQLYDQGHFRLFHRPTKLLSCFPSMTDLAFCRMFGIDGPKGYQALWYDRKRRKRSHGKWNYLTEKNAPWQKHIDYRAPMILDAIGYVTPGFLFRRERDGLDRLFKFKRGRTGTVIGYSVGTATIGTRKGEKGLVKCLKRIDALCEKLIYQHRGRCLITIAADHGHNLTASKYFQVSNALKQAGFKPSKRLKKPRDVVCIEFGLVTYSAIYTDQPEKVADALLERDPIELAIYPERPDGGWIVVRDRTGTARIGKTQRGYVYRIEKGDPLKLKPVIDRLTQSGKVTPAGEIDDRSLFVATVDHEFPDPLARIYRAFNGLAELPADIIVTLKDGWFCGAKDLARSVSVASTHGSLNQANSATFVMSMIRELPGAVRISELKDKDVLPEIMPTKSRR